ncbi:MAG: molybdopterin-dependent oxidoreductase [Flavobacteriaceae bacterium]
MRKLITRRRLIASIGAGGAGLTLAGCDRLGATQTFGEEFLSYGNWLSYRVHRLIGASSMAREYSASEMSPTFRTNGSTEPLSGEYQQLAANGFAGWRLKVEGRVRAQKSFSLADLMAMPARSQITRHDCVEGWSAIGKWTGVQLARVLDEAGLMPDARYIVFHCADNIGLSTYYESIDLVDAYHPQTILAYGMNGAVLPIGHGAPIRLRVERQLGYKHAKFVMRIEAVRDLSEVGLGKGGYWEDAAGYDWYAGI